ncbi:unnamed protein product [Musa hybrid cultivar]
MEIDDGTVGEKSWVVEIDGQSKKIDPLIENKQWSKQSIYRVPACIKKLNREVYTPQIVSFGPYHHGENDLMPMEEHKHRALLHFLKKAKKPFHEFMAAMEAEFERLQEAYQSLDERWKDKESFLRLVILDGCFMLEIMRVKTQKSSDHGYAYDDPVFSESGIHHNVPYIKRDMMMIENQLPLLVLDQLVLVEGLHRTAEKYVDELMQRFWEWKSTASLGQRLHPLGVLHSVLLKPCGQKNRDLKTPKMDTIIRSAVELHEAGIRFKTSESDSLLDIWFDNGVLSLPKLTVDDNTKYIFLNLMAFERLHVCAGNDVTSFVCFMDHIIDSAKDINLLHYKGIILNAVGSDEAAAELFNRLTKDVVLDPSSSLGKVQNDVKNYIQNDWRRHRANLRHTYFTSPWTTLSLMAAIVLLILTVLQTIYTMLQFHLSA